jgi:hypothetical protein
VDTLLNVLPIAHISRAEVITLTFCFPRPDAMPRGFLSLGRETSADRNSCEVMSACASSTHIIPPTERISTSKFPRQLESHGFELIDAGHQVWSNSKDPSGRRALHVLRFILARHDAMNPEFAARKEAVRTMLGNICGRAFWRVQLTCGSVFLNGSTDATSGRVFSFKMDARIPRFFPGGSPVTERPKGPDGRRIKHAAPLPIEAAAKLRVRAGIFQLV